MIGNSQVLKKYLKRWNSFFSEIGPKLASNLSDPSVHFTRFTTRVDSSFRLSDIDDDTVLKHLKNLKTNKAVGLDDIAGNLLKEAAPVVDSSLCNIFNTIATGIFSDEWKIAKVFPLHKGKERDDLNNYRPISVLPILAKLFEKIVFDQVYLYLSINMLLSNQVSVLFIQLQQHY